MQKGIISLGEALIDFIPTDQENIFFQKCPGGAPANVAVGVARLGAESYFVGKVGDDMLGNFLAKTLHDYGVNTEHVHFSKENRTGVVFVTIDKSGERSFEFYIDPSADRFLTESEIEETLFDKSGIFHFGSISLISEPSKSATIKAIALAQKYKLIISYDPNLRHALWESEHHARETILSVMAQADVVKLSEEELVFLTHETEMKKAVTILEKYEIPLLLVTAGSKGCHVFFKKSYHHVPAKKVIAVDTTGAGDAFVSGMLYRLHEKSKNILDFTMGEIVQIIEFASVSGAIAASSKGAMNALPGDRPRYFT